MTPTAAGRRLATRLGRVLWLGGWLWLAAALLVAGATSGWLDTPLGGSVPGHRVPLNVDALAGQPAGSPRPLLSFGLLCAVATILAVCAAVGRAPRVFAAHVGAAILLLVLTFPVVVLARSAALLEALTAQGRDREAIRRFAEFVGGYSAGLPPLELAGTATLADRVSTTLQVTGWGWWLTLAGAVVLIAVGLGGRLSAGRIAGGLGWAAALAVVVAVIAGPAVVAEYQWMAGDTAYATGRYGDALARYDRVVQWAPWLHDNPALRYRRGAAEFWLAGPTSAAARGFLADNLRRNGDVDSAVDLVGRATLEEPGLAWLRRNIAETYAEQGVREARRSEQFATPAARWLRAREIDPGLVRVHYYLAHAYYRAHGRDQEPAIGEASHLITLVRDPGIRSDLLALVGDCHFKAERDDEARTHYRRALATVPLFSRVNLQAQKGLLGL